MCFRHCKMYYRIYRRRQYIYVFLAFLFLLYLFFGSSDKTTSVNRANRDELYGERQAKANAQITVDSYVPPPPCVGCPGENGEPVYLSAEESKGVDEIIKKEFFNLRVSDKVSLWRTLPDMRSSECKNKMYPTDLPTTSVVIIFKDERWSPVLRTVYSVLHRSAKHLLKEIILVDDQSEHEELKQKLEDYCAEHFGSIVKILRTPKRLGLIGAKNFGGRHATGDVLVFLDAHCEASEGWLEPILARIKEKRSTVVCPTIDSIDDKTLSYQYGGSGGYGIFTWSLFFTWGSMPDRVRTKLKSSYDPYPSPTMAGGLLAADREYFFEIGGYDDGMEVWGGENLELSFRTWMCGGSLEFIPCSHVGHIFRPGHPYNMTGEEGKNDVHGRNSMRLAEVWMDDYKRLYYTHRRDLQGKDYGDVSSRKEIRTRLNCNNFKWFLDNVYPEKFIPDENVFGFGEVRNPGSSFCLDSLNSDDKGHGELGLFFCQSGASANQVFSWSHSNEIRREETCCAVDGAEGSIIKLNPCSNNQNQKWDHTKDGQIVSRHNGLCIDLTDVKNGELVKLQKCESLKQGQLWQFKNYIS